MPSQDTLSSVLIDFARNMLTEFRVQDILDRLVTRIVDVLPVTGAGVTLISPGLVPQYIAASDAAARSFEQLQTDFGEGPCRVASETNQAVVLPDLALVQEYGKFIAAAQEAGMAAVFSFPLRHEDTRLGALDLYRDTTGLLSDEEMATAQTLADVVAAYLINAQSRARALEDVDWFRDRALHDPLTGLANRVLLQERLEHASKRAERTQGTSAVVFADLDGFKQVNDTYGHAAGDGLLVAVGERLAALIRPGDTLARISGDEFVILCEDLEEHDVVLLPDRIGAAFVEPFVVDDLVLRVSASLGMAVAGPGQPLSGQLLLDADAAMYGEKLGRGKARRVVSVHPTDVPTEPFRFVHP